jgi:VWFA-related protein
LVAATPKASLLAQDQAQPSGPTSTSAAEKSGRLVLIDVIATDLQGKPVEGLKEDDFQVSETVDWVKHISETIVSFRPPGKTTQENSTRARRFFLSKPPEAAGDLSATAEPVAPLAILLLDGLNTDLFAPPVVEQVSSMADAGCNPDSADPSCVTPIAVLGLGPHLEILQDFNSERSVLRETLHRVFAGKTSKAGHAPKSDAKPAVVSESSEVAETSSSLPMIRGWDRSPHSASIRERRVQLTMDAIRAIARHMAGYPGRKRLIWVSSSFPFSIGPDPAANGSDDARSYRSQVAVVMNALADARVSVYPARPGLLPSQPASERAVGREGEVESARMPLQANADYFAATVPMEVFARSTGGEACVDDIDLAECFKQVMGHGLFDYEIAYAPPSFDWKEGFHRIEVSTPYRGVHLAFRHYYYVRSKIPAGADLELKQAACDDPMTATSLKLKAELQSPAPQLAKYELMVEGKMLSAASLENGQRLHLHLDFAVCTFDNQGKPLQHVQYSTQRDLSAEEFKSVQGNMIRRTVAFQPAERSASLRWVVRDSLTGKLGSIDLPYQPPTSVAAVDEGPTGHAISPQTTSPQTAAPQTATPPTVLPQTSVPSAQQASIPNQVSPVSGSEERNVLEPELEVKPYCDAIASRAKHSEALGALCRFSLSLPRKMPNVICDLETRRHWRAYNIAHRDIVTATVAYSDGQERYSNLRIDGNVADPSSPSLNSSWSMGELASTLQMVFSPVSEAEFRFSKDAKVSSIPALVFDFHVEQLRNELYYLHAFYSSGWGTTLFPAYRGKIWINKSNFNLMRIEKETADMPQWYPISRATTVIDYSDVPLGDGSSFVLPNKSEIETCERGEVSECAHNVVRFKDWHKFRAKTRILPIEESH